MPLITPSLEYRLGLSRDFCPTCGKPLPASVVVSRDTVVDVYDVWPDGYRDEAVKVVVIETKTEQEF